jgi:Zn-dependent protease with chaperone function
MSDDLQEVTDIDCAELASLIEETAIPIRSTSDPTVWFETDEATRSLDGEAVGWWPVRSRQVVLAERCFDRLTDEELLGVVAHELGHHAGYHGLLGKIFKACVGLVGLGVIGGLWAGAALFMRSGEWFLVALVVLGIVCLLLLPTIGVGMLRRWMEYDATRRGAILLGRTEPLEALYEPRADEPYGDWWPELVYPYPHPSAQLARLEALADDLDSADEQ